MYQSKFFKIKEDSSEILINEFLEKNPNIELFQANLFVSSKSESGYTTYFNNLLLIYKVKDDSPKN